MTGFTMKLLTLFLCLSLTVVAFVSSADVKDDEDVSMVKFKKFKNRYRKKYNKGAQCSYYRRWRNRKKMVFKHNQAALLGNSSFTLVDNQFADETVEEWNSLLGLVIPGQFNLKKLGIKDLTAVDPNKSAEDRQVISSTITIPSSLDLRRHRCMPPIKSQLTCGACWAFIATTSVEFQSCLKNITTPVRLSEQQLIDCSRDYDTNGCNGGFYTNAWDYLINMGGQVANATYPYKGTAGSCQYSQGITKVSGRLSRYIYLDSNERTILSALLQRGPITVSIAANSKFILYSSGIFDDDSCKNGTINHGVVLVGYGRANGTDYWIVRNSWGTSWGLNGYILMKRNVNICRLAEYAFLALL
ncbi:ervatamin-B-like [Daphnia pulex]|uniref:ervatamin-B-like n=1 Tax=Daphnia pulex TaxID=6669 RepID=UPI001EDCD821|nr:ervatamin-B-like [Daphnia pulex]